MPAKPKDYAANRRRALAIFQQTGTAVVVHVPHPARNLGAHLKKPTSGEIVTSHHRGARKK